jgi:hypothetical protein
VETANIMDYVEVYYFSDVKHSVLTTCRTIEIKFAFPNLRYWMYQNTPAGFTHGERTHSASDRLDGPQNQCGSSIKKTASYEMETHFFDNPTNSLVNGLTEL